MHRLSDFIPGFEESLSKLRIDPPRGLSVHQPDIVQPLTKVYPEGPWVKVKVTQDKPYKSFSFAKWPTAQRTGQGNQKGDLRSVQSVVQQRLRKDYQVCKCFCALLSQRLMESLGYWYEL